MPVTSAALLSELQTDPQGLGYAAATTDRAKQTIINQVRAGAPYSVFRKDVSAAEVVACIAVADFNALTQLQLLKLQTLLIGGVVDVTNSNFRQNFQAIFSGASAATTNAIQAAASRQGSRAEVLFGAGTVVSEQQIGETRNGA